MLYTAFIRHCVSRWSNEKFLEWNEKTLCIVCRQFLYSNITYQIYYSVILFFAKTRKRYSPAVSSTSSSRKNFFSAGNFLTVEINGSQRQLNLARKADVAINCTSFILYLGSLYKDVRYLSRRRLSFVLLNLRRSFLIVVANITSRHRLIFSSSFS